MQLGSICQVKLTIFKDKIPINIYYLQKVVPISDFFGNKSFILSLKKRNVYKKVNQTSKTDKGN